MTILFFVYKSRANVSGEAPIMMRITIDAKRANFSTNLFIDPKLWDQTKQKIKGTSPLSKEMNNVLAGLNTAALAAYNDYVRKNMPAHPEAIRNAILQKDGHTTTLLQATAFVIENLRVRIGYDTSENTVKKYQTVERKLRTFLTKELNRSDLYLHELSYKFINDFDLFMRVREGLRNNAVMKNMQQLKRVAKVCLKNGWLDKDPFMDYSCKLDETERGYLTAAELATIEQVQLPSRRLDQVRDVFVFCAYTGLAYADVSKLCPDHFEKGNNGMDWIMINRTKTKSKSMIPLLPTARRILEKYQDTALSSKKEILPVISNQNLNKYLKEIAQQCGITKRVSMHLARHTFATTVTLERGIDITTVSRMLGHKRLSTTQVYSKVTQLRIANDVQKIMTSGEHKERGS